MIQIVPSGQHVLRDPVRRRAAPGAQHLDQGTAPRGPHVEIDRPTPSRAAGQPFGAVESELPLRQEVGHLVPDRPDRLRPEGEPQIGHPQRRLGDPTGTVTGTTAELSFGFAAAFATYFGSTECAIAVTVTSFSRTTLEGTWTTNESCQAPAVDQGR